MKNVTKKIEEIMNNPNKDSNKELLDYLFKVQEKLNEEIEKEKKKKDMKNT